MWERFEYFSGYGFNKSHAISYSAISFQCAWLYNYYPVEWMAAFLDKEPEKRKERAINIAKSNGFEIVEADINTSSFVWEIHPTNDKVLVQPLAGLKGLGDAAIQQIVDHRPFNNIEEFLFHDEIVYSKLNKKALDVLCRSGALNKLMDDRFTGRKHFWSAVAVERVYSRKKFNENIESYQEEADFSVAEEIDNLTTLTGIFPMHLVMTPEVRHRLEANYVPPVSDFDPDLGVVWFIPREIIRKKTKNGKLYWIVAVIDSNSVLTKFRCWGIVEGKDRIHLNRPYMAKLDYDPAWGFSTRSIKRNLRLLG
jgi:DNA polymerase III alpha subunit